MKYDYLEVVRTHEVQFIVKKNKKGIFKVDEKATIKRFKYLLGSDKVRIENLLNKQDKKG
tara:strand:+ start:384 stop:563 length:180 start_codon:yes stop_codon:yes gene_type:complete